MKDLVSIIIPVYNREKFIAKTLESIILQSHANWECILVDDGSNDSSPEIIKNFINKDARFVLFFRPENTLKGANTCRNLGFVKCKGDYVNWFDSDDTMHKDFIKRKLDVFQANKNIDIVLSKTVRVENGKEPVYESRTYLTNSILEDYITRKVSWFMPDGMFDKRFLNNEFFFDEHLKGGQDRDFYIKVLTKKPRIFVLDFYATNYVVHNESISEKLYRVTKDVDNNIYHFSHFESLVNQVIFLKQKNLWSKNLELHYFTEIKKKLPYVMRLKKKIKFYYKILFQLTTMNRFYLKEWLNIVLASLSFYFFGKGEKLLK